MSPGSVLSDFLGRPVFLEVDVHIVKTERTAVYEGGVTQTGHPPSSSAFEVPWSFPIVCSAFGSAAATGRLISGNDNERATTAGAL